MKMGWAVGDERAREGSEGKPVSTCHSLSLSSPHLLPAPHPRALGTWAGVPSDPVDGQQCSVSEVGTCFSWSRVWTQVAVSPLEGVRGWQGRPGGEHELLETRHWTPREKLGRV